MLVRRAQAGMRIGNLDLNKPGKRSLHALSIGDMKQHMTGAIIFIDIVNR